MAFKLGPKRLIVNDPAQAQLLFLAVLAGGTQNVVETDDDFLTGEGESEDPYGALASSPDTLGEGENPEGDSFSPASTSDGETVAQADMLRIVGFADLVGADIQEVIGFKAVPGQNQISTVTFTVGSLKPGEEIKVDIDFSASDLRGEFATYFSDYKRKRSFVITAKTGDDAPAIATKLVNDIKALKDSGWSSWIDATSNAGVVTLTGADPNIAFSVSVDGDAAGVTATVAVTQKNYEGRGTWEQLKSLRLETVLCPYGEPVKIDQVPIRGAKYSQYKIIKRVSRPDLAGLDGTINTVPVGDFELELFVNESLTGYISDLTKWLNANVAKRTMYTATSASSVLSGDSATVVTSVDSTPPFTNPLV